jgi:uncharacterized membrane protein
VIILLLPIGGYLLVPIGGYSINGYWWLLMIILLMAIGDYFINGYL